MDPLVSREWLAAEMGAPDLRIVDATYHALDPARDAAAEFAAGHIAGAVHLHLASLKDGDTSLPSMLPPADAFAARLAALGIGAGDRIILYDSSPHRTSCRAWWMFRTFGLDNVAVLDGGLAAWTAAGHPQESGSAGSPGAPPPVRKDGANVRDLDAMRANVASGAEQVVDARGAPRFTGKEADPRGLAPGHIPGSLSLPYMKLIAADGTFRPVEELRAIFAAAGITADRPIVTTCGSGITAAVVLFALYLTGRRDLALYDGSWSEWGARDDTPKATGPA